jgi:hypothetical protein
MTLSASCLRMRDAIRWAYCPPQSSTYTFLTPAIVSLVLIGFCFSGDEGAVAGDSVLMHRDWAPVLRRCRVLRTFAAPPSPELQIDRERSKGKGGQSKAEETPTRQIAL